MKKQIRKKSIVVERNNFFSAHLRHVAADPDYISAANDIWCAENEGKKDVAAIEALAQKFKIQPFHIEEGLGHDYYVITSVPMVVTHNGNMLTIQVPDDITQREMMAQFALIDLNRGGSPKRQIKSQLATELGYAIFMARKSGMSFPDITSAIQDGELPRTTTKNNNAYLNQVKQIFYAYEKNLKRHT